MPELFLSLRRHDPDQVQRVTAPSRISAPAGAPLGTRRDAAARGTRCQRAHRPGAHAARSPASDRLAAFRRGARRPLRPAPARGRSPERRSPGRRRHWHERRFLVLTLPRRAIGRHPLSGRLVAALLVVLLLAAALRLAHRVQDAEIVLRMLEVAFRRHAVARRRSRRGRVEGTFRIAAAPCRATACPARSSRTRGCGSSAGGRRGGIRHLRRLRRLLLRRLPPCRWFSATHALHVVHRCYVFVSQPWPPWRAGLRTCPKSRPIFHKPCGAVPCTGSPPTGTPADNAGRSRAPSEPYGEPSTARPARQMVFWHAARNRSSGPVRRQE